MESKPLATSTWLAQALRTVRRWLMRSATRSGGAFLQCVLDDIGVVLVKGRFAVGQVELPDPHKALVEAVLQHLRALRQKGLAPAAQRLGVINSKGVFVHHLQPG